jgi:hypothetical protein
MAHQISEYQRPIENFEELQKDIAEVGVDWPSLIDWLGEEKNAHVLHDDNGDPITRWGCTFRDDGTCTTREGEKRWMVELKSRFFSPLTYKEAKQGSLIKPDRLHDAAGFHRRMMRVEEHINLRRPRREAIVERIRAIIESRGKDSKDRRILGVLENKNEKADEPFSWFYVSLHPSSYGEGDSISWSWLRDEDMPEELAQVAYAGSYACELAVQYLHEENRRGEWWHRYHVLKRLRDSAILKRLPAPRYHQRFLQMRASIDLPGGYKELWVSDDPNQPGWRCVWTSAGTTPIELDFTGDP